MSTISPAYVKKSLTYEAYEQLIADLLARGRTTGTDQSEAFVHYTQLNQQRMHRLDKTALLLPSVELMIKAITVAQTWLVLTEAWCGDAAQSIPVMHRLAALNPVISLRLLLRDENPELMDRYLTNGTARSIPRLIAVDTLTLEELFTWGPRPSVLQQLFYQWRAEGIEYHLIKEELQRWYNKDRTISRQEELAALASGASSAAKVGMIA
ncbi:MAG TPA: thioredoxin family protein [Puia sp.]|nr:thioredoxin family protein [Puia sp.]